MALFIFILFRLILSFLILIKLNLFVDNYIIYLTFIYFFIFFKNEIERLFINSFISREDILFSYFSIRIAMFIKNDT